MATTFKTPGVYIQEISTFPPSVAEVETAIPAFIGYTEYARQKPSLLPTDPVPTAAEFPDADDLAAALIADDLAKNDLRNKPKRIASLADYRRFFGGPRKETGLSVRLDENIQKVDSDCDANCVTERVDITVTDVRAVDATRHNMFYSMQFYFANGGGPCYIVSVGNYGDSIDANELTTGLQAVRKVDEVTLIVFPESEGLTRDDDSDNVAYADYKLVHDLALQQCEDLKDRFVVMDVIPLRDDTQTILDEVALFRDNGIGTNNLKYGASYAPYLETVFDYDYNAADVTVTHNLYYQGALVDPANPPDNIVVPDTYADLDEIKSSEDGLYNTIIDEISALPLLLPPSPGMVGIYANVDNVRGVWKAPANVSMVGVVRPSVTISDDDQETLNVDSTAGKSVNAIRFFTGRGNLVWGARTLDGNSNEWRYVSVRRFFNMAEESIKKASLPFVFESNDRNTWNRISGMITNFLTVQWRNGALQGATPEDAFFVRVGLPETMTALDILEGRMNVEVGMAVVRPAEFIILKFTHKLPES